MEADDRQRAADSLWDAAETRSPIAPLTDTFRGMDVTDAYSVQLLNIDRHRAAGRTVRGHKVGLSSRAMQKMLGVDEPDYGHLLDNMFEFECSTIDVSRLIQPRIEIEVAFVLGRALTGPGVTVADVIRATEFVLPSFEIVDSRVVDWKIRLEDTVADNASSAMVVLGGSPTLLTDIDVRMLDGSLMCNGEIRETGKSDAVLGNPAVAVAWLANKIASFGISLQEGDVIMPGSFTRMIPVRAGDELRADFERLGPVSITFADSASALDEEPHVKRDD
jgi:2-keto-4-pentenoate hydratase